MSGVKLLAHVSVVTLCTCVGVCIACDWKQQDMSTRGKKWLNQNVCEIGSSTRQW